MESLTVLGTFHEKANSTLQKRLKDKDIPVSCGHITLLMLVFQNNGFMEIRQIVKILKKRKTTVSEIVNTLEKNGYLKKFRSTEDKRIYCVKTTKEAELLKPVIEEVLQNMHKDVVANVSEEEIAVLVKVLNQFIVNLEEE